MSVDRACESLCSGSEQRKSLPAEELVGVAGDQVPPQGYEAAADWEDDEDVDNDGGADCSEDAHTEGQGAERRAWSRKEDEAITRLVRSPNHPGSDPVLWLSPSLILSSVHRWA